MKRGGNGEKINNGRKDEMGGDHKEIEEDEQMGKEGGKDEGTTKKKQ